MAANAFWLRLSFCYSFVFIAIVLAATRIVFGRETPTVSELDNRRADSLPHQVGRLA
jgi:hypothetical protein